MDEFKEILTDDDIENEGKDEGNSQFSIVTLTSENGENIDFIDLASISYNGKSYSIMQHAEMLDGVSDDDVIMFDVWTDDDGKTHLEIITDKDVADVFVFEVWRDDDGKAHYEIVTDKDIADAVCEEFISLYYEQEDELCDEYNEFINDNFGNEDEDGED